MDRIKVERAIDGLTEWRKHVQTNSYIDRDISTAIEALKAQLSLEGTTSDLISRQAAIDALHTWFRDGFDEDKWWNSTHVLAAIEGLPSVQQEHKWETCFECPLSHGCPKIKGCTNEQAIEYASQIPNDCPLSAQPEPQWIPVSERLPEDYVDVLVWFEYFRYGDYNCMYATHGIGNYSKEYNSWTINHETGWKDLHVFAWMPLPEPYKPNK